MAKRTCVVFGAGALGLGFLGAELAGDYEMIYADVPAKSDLLDHLSAERSYVYNETGPSARPVTVTGVRGLDVTHAGAVSEALAAADVVFTAVGEPVLPKLAPTLAAAAAGRTTADPLRILCSENGLDIGTKCRALIEGAASEVLGGRLVVGDTVMGRMCQIVSPVTPGLEPVAPGLDWAVSAEPFFGIPVCDEAMRGLDAPGAAFQVMPEAEFAAQEDVKMWAHNGLHAVLAFLGHLGGREFFCELTDDSTVMHLATDMMRIEVGEALLRKHGPALDRNFYMNYAPTIVRRIICPGLHDAIARGTRGAMRKLQPWERLVSGLRGIAACGIEPARYGTGLAAGVLVAQQTGETDLGFREVLTDHCGLDPNAEQDLIALIEDRREWLPTEFGAA